MKTQFMALMALVALVGVASADTLFQANFETSAGYPSGNDQQIKNTVVSYGTWGVAFGKGSAVTSTYTDPAAGGPFGSQDARAWDTTASLAFNTNSSVGNGIVRLEGFMEMTGNSVAGAYGEFGLLDSTDTRQLSIRMASSNGTSIVLAYRSGATTVNSSMAIDAGFWYRLRAELNYETDTFKIWAAKVTVDGTTKIIPELTDANLVSFGGLTENSFSSGSIDYASKIFMFGTTGHNTFFDNISVESIPEPMTLCLLALGGGMLCVARKRK